MQSVQSIDEEENADHGDGKVYKLFCKRVTVAGVEELYIAESCAIRFLFVFGLLVSTAFCVFTSIEIVYGSFDETTPVEIQFNDDNKMIFPNITICTTAVANKTAAKELLVVPEEVEKKLKKLQFDRDQFIDQVIQFASLSVLPREINQTFLWDIDKVFTATVDHLTPDGRSIFVLMNHTIPQCNLTLSNCTFDGKWMDCCNKTVNGAFDGFVCYGIPISEIPHNITRTNFEPILFNVDVKMDWTHISFVRGDDAFDGFLVIVGQPCNTMNNMPVAVSPGWHGTIKLSGIKERTDRTNCWPKSHLPKLAYFDYYDEDGKNCELEILLESIQWLFQCTIAVGNYFPNSTEGCGFRQAYAGLIGGSGSLDEALLENAPDEIKRKFNGIGEQGAYRNRMGSMTKRCRPICDRWQYEPIVGYSELMSSSGTNGITNNDANISWSRITISIPSTYYEEHKEGQKSSLYMITCNVGGTVGVCLGASVITIVQLVGYGLYTGYLFREKRRKIMPIALEAK